MKVLDGMGILCRSGEQKRLRGKTDGALESGGFVRSAEREKCQKIARSMKGTKMNRGRKYDKWRPLLQAEKGDSIIITVSGPNKKNIPCGKYNGVYQGDYRIKCEIEPRLNGAYTYW